MNLQNKHMKFTTFLAIVGIFTFLGAGCDSPTKPSRDNPYDNNASNFNGPFMTFVSIPSGSFSMGSLDQNDAQPIHTVTLDGFEMSESEVTQSQYMAVMGINPSFFTGDDNLPVEQVTWFDAVRFCNRLSDEGGLNRCYNETAWECDFTKNGYRLPTEAEWEYACRAGSTTIYYCGDNEDNLSSAGWYKGNSGSNTHPVKMKTPNAWGLYDMHGNVWEWCNDWYETYNDGIAQNPIGPITGTDRLRRGGAYSSIASFCPVYYRWSSPPETLVDYIGFRVVRGVTQ
jgi:formylglycine-generating enzyme required for sulfatase activity